MTSPCADPSSFLLQVDYTGALGGFDGDIFDSSIGEEPLQFRVGSNSIIDGQWGTTLSRWL